MNLTTYGHGSAFTVENFLSQQECTEWIARANAVGFQEDAPVTTRNGFRQRPDIRNNARAMCDRPDWAAEIWKKMNHLFESSSSSTPIGLNERFRFYRYSPGQYFKPHLDGAYYRSDTERSLWTVLVYLNGDMEGGETE